MSFIPLCHCGTFPCTCNDFDALLKKVDPKGFSKLKICGQTYVVQSKTVTVQGYKQIPKFILEVVESDHTYARRYGQP